MPFLPTRAVLLLLLLGAALPARAQGWDANVAGGRYRNPILFADYSDPDVIRVGEDFYMTSSSFGSVPALPILHSRDLVNWRIINHAVQRLPDAFDLPQHGNGVWAPSLRYHAGYFYIYYGDPDRGVYMVRTVDPRGRWEDPVLVHEAKGWIDPAPLWDDDGRAYLVHAFAKSRAGFNSVLHVVPLSPDGTRTLGRDSLVFDGNAAHRTIEGPKFYKRNGYYYIFAPAGGVAEGWQTVLRSRSPFGPYEDRVVLAQGATEINGPHQGGLVELENGDGWFIHFQERQPYGRIVHLQPVRWIDDWPVIGDGTGQPVGIYAKPGVGATWPSMQPQSSDGFEGACLGLQWQWQGNPRDGWYSLTDAPGRLRLRTQPIFDGGTNLWSAPHLLLQKLPAPSFTATTSMDSDALAAGSTAGLVLFGLDYAFVGVRRSEDGGREIVMARAIRADEGAREEIVAAAMPDGDSVRLRVSVQEGGLSQFFYSNADGPFTAVGEPFQAREGKWVGAKVGLFARGASAEGSYADFDEFIIQ